MTSIHPPYGTPPIMLGRRDAAALTGVALDSMLSAPRSAAPLLREVDRATIVPDLELPDDVAAIGSQVCFRNLRTCGLHRVMLAAPAAADGAGAQVVSVLSPLGSALIGLRPGQSIRWPDLDGGCMRLAVVAVSRATAREAQ
jgi:regulator of nucleoside diphosphate kinase